MKKKITHKTFIDRMHKMPRKIRLKYCEENIYMFALFYFPHLFKFHVPKFHKRWYKLLNFVCPDNGKRFRYLVLMAFRDSAKTSLAKIKVIHDICYKRKKLIAYVCYEKDKSGEALFDIATWLQTNPYLVADFGHLFIPEQKKKGTPEKKSVTNFVTTNGVRVTAFSIRQSVRGRTHDFERPDAYVLDDFENLLTKGSAALTKKAINFFREMMTGLAVNAEIIFVCNYISDVGSVQWLLDTAEGNEQFRVEEVALLEQNEDGKMECVWGDRYALTDKEAEERNAKIKNPKFYVESIESIKRTANKERPGWFEQEYLNQPLVEGERFFDTNKIDERIAVLKAAEWQSEDPKKPWYYKRQGSWKIWGEYDHKSRNVIAADVSEGYGLDSSVIECFDLNTGYQIKEYESSSCPPSALGAMMVNEGRLSKGGLLIPERNSIGVAVVDHIKNARYMNMFREKTVDGTTNKPVHKFGWHTNSKTKPMMLFEFKKDFENGLIIINSIPLLKEMRAYTNSKITDVHFDPEASAHFDRVMAACIAWQGRKVKQIKGIKANK